MDSTDKTRSVPTTVPPAIIEIFDETGAMKTLAQIELEAMAAAVSYHKTMCDAARALGIGRSTLYRKLGGVESPPLSSQE